MIDPQSRRRLDEFLVGNTDLEQLEARLSEFNLFRVLRVERAEIRHSNVLAWLLDPAETHGLGPVFLRRFLSSILMEVKIEGVGLTAAQIELMPFGEVEVYRERHDIDILVRCTGGRGPSAVRWCLLIENKIHAKESKEQLARYREAVAKEFPGDQIIPIFLTLDGDDPSEDGIGAGFVPVSHRHVLDVASAVTALHQARIPNDAWIFLKHYLNSLKRLTMADQDLIDLCKEIYRKHGEAIDLIVEYGKSNQRYELCAAAIGKLVLCTFPPVISRNRVWFVPKELGDLLPNVGMAGWKFLPRPIPLCFWLRYSKSRLRAGLTLEVGPAADQALRHKILDAAAAAKLPVKDKQYENLKYARIVTESMPLRVDNETEEALQSEEYIHEVCTALWNKVWPKAKAIVPALETALRTEREATSTEG